jgi:hypothetical protein
MRLSIALGAGLISFSSAFAASQADRNACDKASTDPEGIRACTHSPAGRRKSSPGAAM